MDDPAPSLPHMHHAQLIRLAEGLLGDPHGAEDAAFHAVQQESKGRRGAAVPRERFLRTVVRNFVRRLSRDAATRQRHERAAARDEIVPASDELVAREELRRRVADAVLALDEPYRTTVALVYLDERPMAEVAERTGVAEGAVRVRLHRAREQLRRRLDREFGSRRAWAALLVPRWPSGMAPALGLLGALIMKKGVVAAGAVLLLVAGSLTVLLSREADVVAPPAPVVAAAPVPVPVVEPEPVRTVVQPPPVASATLPSQEFRCVDELGRLVANAAVRLVKCPLRADSLQINATADAQGLCVFTDLATAHYVIRAHSGQRHYVPDVESSTVKLPAMAMELPLRELWIGGLVLPGVEVITHSFGLIGFMTTQDSRPENELKAEWKAIHPEALFCTAFRNPRRQPADTIPVEVSWFGHQRHKQPLRMRPVSQFTGPEVVDPSAVPTCDWTRVRVVLTDREGRPHADELQEALRQRADLYSGTDTRGIGSDKTFGFRKGTASVPVGDYSLRLYDATNSQMRPAAKCSVAREQTELQIAITIPERVVRLHLRGHHSAGYMLQVVHESGRKAMEFGRADGEHMLLLVPGAYVATLNSQQPDGSNAKEERVFTVGDAVEQDVTWEVGAKR